MDTKRRGLIESAIISTVGSIAARIIGMVMTIFICNQLGAEGTGVYQLMMTVYSLAYMLASAGIIATVSRLIAELVSRGQSVWAQKMMKNFFLIGIVMSTIMGAMLFIYAAPISLWLLKDLRSVDGLKLLAFSIPFMTISACYKGYFFAVRDVGKPVVSELVEQIIKLFSITLFLRLWGSGGIAASCVAIALGIGIGEITSFLYLTLFYIIDSHMLKAQRHMKKEPMPRPFSTIFSVLLPIALGAYIAGVLVMIENAIIPQGLKMNGLTNEQALGTYGIIKGMVYPLLFFPVIFITSGMTIVMPEIAKARTRYLEKRIESLIDRILRFGMILGFVVAAIFGIYGRELGFMIYHNPEVGRYILMLVPIVPFLYIEIMVDGILKGLGEQNSCLIYHTIDSVGRVVLMYYLIPQMGILAVIVVSIGMSIFMSVMMLQRLRKVTGIGIKWRRWVKEPFIAALASILTSKVIIVYTLPIQIALNVKVLMGIGIGIAMYALFLLLLENITKEDLAMFSLKTHKTS